MGLDMYLYKITRLSVGERNRLDGAREELVRAEGYSCFDKDYVDKDYPELFRKAKGLLTQIKVVTRKEDLDAVKRDFGISENAEPTWKTVDSGLVTFKFLNEDGSVKEASLSVAEFKSKYVHDEVCETYAWKADEIAYWRKDYGLQERIHASARLREREADRLKQRRIRLKWEANEIPTVREDKKKLGSILNTEYYPLTKRQISMIEGACGKKFPRPADSGEAIVYWEWY